MGGAIRSTLGTVRRDQGWTQGYSLTEDGNALRLVDTYGDELRFCPERGRWLRWTGQGWHWDIEGRAGERTRELAGKLPDGEKEVGSHRRRSLSAAGVTSALRMAASDSRVVVNIAQLDARATPPEHSVRSGGLAHRQGPPPTP